MIIPYIKVFAYLLIGLLIKVDYFENISWDLNHRLTYYQVLAVAFCTQIRWDFVGPEDVGGMIGSSFASLCFEDPFL